MEEEKCVEQMASHMLQNVSWKEKHALKRRELLLTIMVVVVVSYHIIS